MSSLLDWKGDETNRQRSSIDHELTRFRKDITRWSHDDHLEISESDFKLREKISTGGRTRYVSEGLNAGSSAQILTYMRVSGQNDLRRKMVEWGLIDHMETDDTHSQPHWIRPGHDASRFTEPSRRFAQDPLMSDQSLRQPHSKSKNRNASPRGLQEHISYISPFSTSMSPFTRRDRLKDVQPGKYVFAKPLLERTIPEDRELQKSFRIPNATKAPGYTCSWGAREDGMLCVGILRHEFGAWERIRDDPDLGMKDKFFLEDRRGGSTARSPNAVQLVKRADYLLSVISAEYQADAAESKQNRRIDSSSNPHKGAYGNFVEREVKAQAKPKRQIMKEVPTSTAADDEDASRQLERTDEAARMEEDDTNPFQRRGTASNAFQHAQPGSIVPHYTISRDFSGSNTTVATGILSVLGERDRKRADLSVLVRR